jgi:hypothetical protein
MTIEFRQPSDSRVGLPATRLPAQVVEPALYPHRQVNEITQSQR